MKIKCNKQTLTEATSVVSKAVSSRSSVAALEGILLKAKGGFLELFGYDLDMGISTKIEAQVDSEGEIVIPAKVFLEIVRKLPGDIVHINVLEKCLTEIKSGVSEFTILGIESAEFPELPTIGEVKEISLSQGTLKSMIDQTIFAISQSDAKPIHTGSLFEIENSLLNVVSVDGYRLAKRTEKIVYEENISFVVPGRTLNEISRLLKESEDACFLKVSKKHLMVDINEYRIFTRLLEGDFLDYKNAIAKNETINVTVKTRELNEAVERVSLLISDKLKSPLKVRFADNEIAVSCSTALGKANDTVSAKINGDVLEMGFNNRYLIDALKASQCDEVVLQLNTALSPMKIVPTEGESFLFLVLPVRLKAD